LTEALILNPLLRRALAVLNGPAVASTIAVTAESGITPASFCVERLHAGASDSAALEIDRAGKLHYLIRLPRAA